MKKEMRKRGEDTGSICMEMIDIYTAYMYTSVYDSIVNIYIQHTYIYAIYMRCIIEEYEDTTYIRVVNCIQHV